MTLGESRIGVTSSDNNRVKKIKRAAADFIDLCASGRSEVIDGIRTEIVDREILRLWARAMNGIETAAMYAVKAATKN